MSHSLPMASDDDAEIQRYKNSRRMSSIPASLRWSLPSTGKSSGIRVLYIDYVVQETIVVFDLFTKSEKDNLSDSEKATLKRIVKLLGKELSNG